MRCREKPWEAQLDNIVLVEHASVNTPSAPCGATDIQIRALGDDALTLVKTDLFDSVNDKLRKK